MSEEQKEELTVETEAVEEVKEEAAAEEAVVEEKPAKKRGRAKKQKIEAVEEKPQSEWTERVVQISRVTKVVKGGKKLSFRAIVIVGNKKVKSELAVLRHLKLLLLFKKQLLTEEKILLRFLSSKLQYLTQLQADQAQVLLC